MRVLIDGQVLMGNKTGIGFYCHNLIRGLYQLDGSHEFITVYNKFKPRKQKYVIGEERYIRYPYSYLREIMKGRFLYSIPLERFMGDFDIYHGTNYSILPTKRAKTVLTVCDLVFKKYPETVAVRNLRFLSYFVEKYTICATKLITISESTKKDVVDFFGIDPDKIHVTPLAADKFFRVISPEDSYFAEVRAKYQLPDRFILYVGTLEPRKNLQRLISAFAKTFKRTGCEHKLVLAGGNGWMYDGIFKLVQELGLEDKVIFTGYVDACDLPHLYNLADAFAYVSLYEGFGLPPLEAMQCGIPVLASNVSSIPEVVGEAAILINPLDTEAIADGLEQLLSDTSLYANLKAKGLERAATFQWRQTAQQTLDCYLAAINADR
ncbi:glycosyltransferase family 4 protein [Sporomusa termitida]|uniref:D-inositol-3-phosphate glycosyltransferase n=1 Tax=Sporomusa termitida TaxID=2377 RepID=A0A517DXH1_9FIRM|nr:glycosyltransferase family 1 protein [Sporomusa termitida]QDR82042.1 D-inositol-3-phosphate glycosyltransferase [Sporomusa termitida]